MLIGSKKENLLTSSIIGSALRVHRTLGPGLLEHAYLRCLCYELEAASHEVEAEVFVDLVYGAMVVERAYRLDLIVDRSVIVEIKAVEKVLPVHHAQVLTYLKLTRKSLGLLVNFNTKSLLDGLKRFRQGFP